VWKKPGNDDKGYGTRAWLGGGVNCGGGEMTTHGRGGEEAPLLVPAPLAHDIAEAFGDAPVRKQLE